MIQNEKKSIESEANQEEDMFVFDEDEPQPAAVTPEEVMGDLLLKLDAMLSIVFEYLRHL